MNARSWKIVFSWEFCSARSASFFHLNVSYRHFYVKVCFAHLSSVHTVALTAAGSQPCWKDSFQLIMTGQRKPPTSFATWRGRCDLASSLWQMADLARDWHLYHPSAPSDAPFEADCAGARRSYTVTTIGSICDTTETCQPLAMHSAFTGVNPSLLTFPFTLTLLLF